MNTLLVRHKQLSKFVFVKYLFTIHKRGKYQLFSKYIKKNVKDYLFIGKCKIFKIYKKSIDLKELEPLPTLV